ncbi:MAG: hypothetical protein OXF20_09815 [Gammaproteobacteria bacterium]|nr:hypothetical protein [Gammaproteobacteria bacterium]
MNDAATSISAAASLINSFSSGMFKHNIITVKAYFARNTLSPDGVMAITRAVGTCVVLPELYSCSEREGGNTHSQLDQSLRISWSLHTDRGQL